MAKVWRCTVCGHLHQGEIPPEQCPVCGMGSDSFAEVASEPAALTATPTDVGLFKELLAVFMPHAVAAHFPNALIPTIWLFLLLFATTALPSFENTAFYLLVMSLLAVPVTMATGLYDWKSRFGGVMTPLFRKKIFLSCQLLISLGLAVGLYWSNSGILQQRGGLFWLFLLLLVIALASVVLLGHYGAVLVFGTTRD